MRKTAAIYARVSSDRQKEDHTIASQTAALIQYAEEKDYAVPPEWIFQDEGYSGAILVRPGLEALRDLAAQGQIETALVYSPDRLSRKYCLLYTSDCVVGACHTSGKSLASARTLAFCSGVATRASCR